MPRSEALPRFISLFWVPASNAGAQEYGPAQKWLSVRSAGAGARRKTGAVCCSSAQPVRDREKQPRRYCPRCKGKGTAWSERPVQIRIPAGVETGARLQVRGMGLQGRDGGAAGDFMIVVHVEKHPFFERDGLDIICAVPISFYQAMLGGYVSVPALEGVKK